MHDVTFTHAIPGLRPASVEGASAGATERLRWDPLLIALAIYLLAAVGRIHQLFPVLLPLKPLFFSSLVAVALLYLLPGDRRGRDPFPMIRSVPMRCMVVLLVWGLLSIPGALWVGGAFHTVVDVLLKTVLMAVVLAGAIRGEVDVARLAGAYFAGVALYSGVVLSRFSVGGAAWRLNDLYYYDANDFATLAVTALPLGLHFALHARRGLVRVASIVGVALTTCTFVWTGSRGGFVAALCVGLFILLGYSAIALRWRLTAMAVIALLLGATASEAYWAQMRSLLTPGQDYNLESQEGRKAIWLRGLGYMRDHPVLGVGAGNFPTAEGTISPRASRQAVGRGVKWQAAHNSYVQVGAELGVPGLLLFTGMISSALAGLRLIRARPLAQALTAALLGFAVGACFLSLAYAEAVYVLVALAAGLRRVVT